MVIVSTVTAIAAASLGTGVAIFAGLMLIGFLAGKELLGTSSSNKQKLIARSLNISIIPLLIGFIVIVGIKVAEILA